MTDNTLDKEIDEIIKKYRLHIDKFWNEQAEVGDTLNSTEAKSKLKAIIADREKKMLEFVIGEDEEYIENPKVNHQHVYNDKVADRKLLRAEQRQRAKEWEGRNG